MSVTAAGLRRAARFPITLRNANVTKVTAAVKDGAVVRWLGEIQIFPDAGRIEIVVGIGATDEERAACDAHRALLPRELVHDDPAEWNEVRHNRTGERMWRVGLNVSAPNPLIELELQMLLDNTTEVNA